MGYIKGWFCSLHGLRQQIDNTRDHECALVWLKTCISIHTLVSFVEGADEDTDFVVELVREGTDGEWDTARPNVDGLSDRQRETRGNRKCTQLKRALFDSMEVDSEDSE